MALRSPGWRRGILVAHIAASAGWIGAVFVFAGMAAIGMTHGEAAVVRSAYVVMAATAELTLVPVAVLSFATGILSSLASQWGLFRHYWVVFKLAINVFATVVLVMYLETFDGMAEVAESTDVINRIRNPSPLLHAVLAFGLLAVALVLAVYKPRGRTPWGLRS